MSGFVSELRSYLYWEMAHVNAHSRTTSGSALIFDTGVEQDFAFVKIANLRDCAGLVE